MGKPHIFWGKTTFFKLDVNKFDFLKELNRSPKKVSERVFLNVAPLHYDIDQITIANSDSEKVISAQSELEKVQWLKLQHAYKFFTLFDMI